MKTETQPSHDKTADVAKNITKMRLTHVSLVSAEDLLDPACRVQLMSTGDVGQGVGGYIPRARRPRREPLDLTRSGALEVAEVVRVAFVYGYEDAADGAPFTDLDQLVSMLASKFELEHAEAIKHSYMAGYAHVDIRARSKDGVR